MLNARDEFTTCLTDVKQQVGDVAAATQRVSGASTGDNARVKCVQAYKRELKGNIERVRSMYDGYLLNFNQKDGSLLGSGLSLNKEDQKAI
jgi:multidrug resistance efflux pump